jgi:putative polyketide hydroxylase
VGPAGDLVSDPDSFTDLYGIEDCGAVLVRPDGHVAFRSPGKCADTEATLGNALRKTLACA